MKKILYFCGVLCLTIVLIFNILVTANLDKAEHITISFNSIVYILGLLTWGTIILACTYFLDKWLNKNPTKFKKELKFCLMIIAIALYLAFSIIWVFNKQPAIVGDQIHVSNFAQTIYRGNPDEFLPNMSYAGIPLKDYMQGYKQQIPLAFVYSIFFRIIHTDIIHSIRGLNIVANIFTVLALYKIGKQLSKKHKINKCLLLTLILTFISLPMMATFIYGDIPGLALSLWSVYYIMKYVDTKKARYLIISSAFAMIAYMVRMNSLIFIIATIIYLSLDWFKGFKEHKKDNNNIKQNEALKKSINESTKKERVRNNLINLVMIVVFIVISIIPASIVENHYMNKYGMDKTKAYPKVGHILIGMEESHRANGWYREDIGETALKDPIGVKEEYKERIKDRLKYFVRNPAYTIKFYTDKIASMWTENTYSAVMNNKQGDDDKILKMIEPLTFYQKILLILITLCSLVVIIQNRKNVSLEILFLITIFIGGFAFHILWEAKSRYIIPYIVALIPVASIVIDTEKIKESFVKLKDKFKKSNRSFI